MTFAGGPLILRLPYWLPSHACGTTEAGMPLAEVQRIDVMETKDVVVFQASGPRLGT